jgi:hypothetical protein
MEGANALLVKATGPAAMILTMHGATAKGNAYLVKLMLTVRSWRIGTPATAASASQP